MPSRAISAAGAMAGDPNAAAHLHVGRGRHHAVPVRNRVLYPGCDLNIVDHGFDNADRNPKGAHAIALTSVQIDITERCCGVQS